MFFVYFLLKEPLIFLIKRSGETFRRTVYIGLCENFHKETIINDNHRYISVSSLFNVFTVNIAISIVKVIKQLSEEKTFKVVKMADYAYKIVLNALASCYFNNPGHTPRSLWLAQKPYQFSRHDSTSLSVLYSKLPDSTISE